MRSATVLLSVSALFFAGVLPSAARPALHDDKQKASDQDKQKPAGQDKQKPAAPQNPPGAVTIAVQMPLRDGMRTIAGQVSADGKPWSGKVQVMVVPSTLAPSRCPGSNERTSRPVKGKTAPTAGTDVQDKTNAQATTTVTLTCYAQKADAMSDEKGNFVVPLAQPIVAMQRVRVCAGEDFSLCPEDGLEVNAATSWGRVRPYFAGGVVFSKENDDFSQQDLTLSLTIDNNWWQGIDENGRPSGRLLKQVNTFFDTRLTSVPVSTPESSANAGGGTAAGNAKPNVDTFIQSRKAAVIQGGIYLPMYWSGMIWTHESATNALFLAPLVKLGIATTTAGQTTTNATTTGNTTSSTTTTVSTTKDLYRFYSIGFGLGHYKLADSKNNAPELISYLHFTFGKWENFEWNKWRLGVEGRLKIPDAPLQIGFDANVLPHGDGKGDLRIVFGTRFDIGELIGKLHTF